MKEGIVRTEQASTRDLFGEENPRELPEKRKRSSARALKPSPILAGDRNLLWVDPADCRIWELHDRAYDLLNEENCTDLISGIRVQGRQEFPAIVRRTKDGDDATYEVICGARRHFAVSWLRANSHPEFQYLVEIRDLTDEEAFRLADVENRDRKDISDFERACAYANALE